MGGESVPETGTNLPSIPPSFAKNRNYLGVDLAAGHSPLIIAGFLLCFSVHPDLRLSSLAGGPVSEVLFAGVAQLVEHHVANVVVVGSNPITRFAGVAHAGIVRCAQGKRVPSVLDFPGPVPPVPRSRFRASTAQP